MQFFGVEMTAEDFMVALDWEATHTEDRIVLISEIWLDHASHMAKLEAILSGQLSAPPRVVLLKFLQMHMQLLRYLAVCNALSTETYHI